MVPPLRAVTRPLKYLLLLPLGCSGAESPRVGGETGSAPPQPPAEKRGPDVGSVQQAPEAPASVVAMTTWMGCKVRSDGLAVTWGTLPSGATVTEETRSPSFRKPRAVPGTKGARSCALGRNHACVVLADGGVRCWGLNTMGQVGDQTIEDRVEAVAVAGLPPASAVAVGVEHSCAALRDGSVACWGDNRKAQLGIASEPETTAPLADIATGRHPPKPKYRGPVASLKPVTVPGLADVIRVAAFGSRTCAVRRDGGVLCWGADSHNPQPADAVPVLVEHLSDVADVALGDTHHCARLRDGTVRCWGSNHSGELGIGKTEETWHDASVPVPGLADVADIAVGGHHTCAVTKAKGELYCWGLRGNGQFGEVSDEPQFSPLKIAEVPPSLAVGAGPATTCAATRDGGLWCFGTAGLGQVPGVFDTKVAKPTDVSALVNAAVTEAHPFEVKRLAQAPDPACVAIATKLGYTRVRVQCRQVSEPLRVYRASMRGPDVPAGYRDQFTVLSEDGKEHRHGGGLEAFAAHLKAVGAYKLEELSSSDAVYLLRAMEAFPPGFGDDGFLDGRGGRVPKGFPKPGLERNPFTLTLVRSRSAGGGGGYSPPSWTAAILTGKRSYAFRWTLKDLGQAEAD